MFEIVLIVLVALVFAKAGKNKSAGSIGWALIGVAYYFIGRIFFSGILILTYKFFLDAETGVEVIFALSILELTIGILTGLLFAYILGEISGLNIKKGINIE